MATSGRGKDYLDKFDSSVYLDTYNGVQNARGGHTLRCFYDALQTVPDNVDYGAGPSLLPSIAAASKASEIILAEYAESNRKVLREWLDGDPAAYDWTPHFNYVVGDLEGKGGEEVAVSQEKVRKIVKAVVHCDLTQEPIIDSSYNTLCDVVASSLVMDAIPETYEEYVELICCLGNLVKPGGSLFLYCVDNAMQQYTVGDHTFKSLHVSSDQVTKAMEIAGFGNIQLSDNFILPKWSFCKFFFHRGIRQ